MVPLFWWTGIGVMFVVVVTLDVVEVTMVKICANHNILVNIDIFFRILFSPVCFYSGIFVAMTVHSSGIVR